MLREMKDRLPVPVLEAIQRFADRGVKTKVAPLAISERVPNGPNIAF
jgi:hypothetical protein